MSAEKELNALEESIRKLSHEYDVFLFGTHGKLPVEFRRKVQGTLRALADQKLEPSDRFRLNTISGRFTAECERWDRVQRDKEEGRGRFGRPTSGVSISPPLNARPAASVKPAEAHSGERMLFDRYLRARRGNGEDVSQLNFEKFTAQLAMEREKVSAKTGRSDWEFDLAEGDGRVRLVIRPAKGRNG